MQTSDTQANAQAQINKPLLQLGARGEAVRELQVLLTNLSVYIGTIDGIFGRDVKSAVIAYQHRVFLVEDGIVGPLTWQALYAGGPVNMPILQQGSKGKTVLTLQRLLNITKDYLGAIDGDFGSGTKAAVQAFQKRSGLVADGIVGDRTWNALSKIPH
ncbi:MAG TPA: peptidoglycan-binding protein [Coleofasciculaceae cyanobacterium]|jgi:peptidoglycan hydrolase-like protein with peptidoglycan-binding domain